MECGTPLGGSAAPKIVKRPLKATMPLCPSNFQRKSLSYNTIYNVMWNSVPEGKPGCPLRYKYHITINPAPDVAIRYDTVNANIDFFKTVVTELQSKVLFTRLLGVYENDNKKLHFHLLVNTKELKSLIGLLKHHYAGLKHSKYAVCSKAINLNRYNKNILLNSNHKMRKSLMQDEINYIRNTYFRKEEHNKKTAFIFSEIKTSSISNNDP
jgi:hypothetical protein